MVVVTDLSTWSLLYHAEAVSPDLMPSLVNLSHQFEPSQAMMALVDEKLRQASLFPWIVVCLAMLML
jgi:hypothetical protein